MEKLRNSTTPELSTVAVLRRKKDPNVGMLLRTDRLVPFGSHPAKEYKIPTLNLLASMARREEHDMFLLTPQIARSRMRREKITRRPPEEAVWIREEDRHDVPAEIAEQ